MIREKNVGTKKGSAFRVAAILALAVIAAAVRADDRYWVGPDNSGGSTDENWDDPNNWNLDLTAYPDGSDQEIYLTNNANVGVDGIFIVDNLYLGRPYLAYSGGANLDIGNFGGALDVYNNVVIGDQASSSVTVEEAGYLEIDGNSLIIGNHSGVIGTLSVLSNGQYNAANPYAGSVQSNLANYSTVQLAPVAGSTGIINLGQSGFNPGYLDFNEIHGGAGSATVNILNDDSQNTPYIMTVNQADPTTSAPVNITGSTAVNLDGGGWTVFLNADNTYTGGTNIHNQTLEIKGGTLSNDISPIVVGVNSGDNAGLLIDSAATVVSQSGEVAANDGSQGYIEVTGPGSSWTAVDPVNGNNDIHIGARGLGSLSILNGGLVTAHNGTLGYDDSHGNGSATISDAGSEWNCSNELIVGGAGAGKLTVMNGGNVTVAAGSGTITLGENSGSIGTLNIGNAAGFISEAPGTISAAEILQGSGTANLIFNHTSTNYTFAPEIAGTVNVYAQAGRTVLTGALPYNGSTTIATGATLTLGIASGSQNFQSILFATGTPGCGTLEQAGAGTTVITGNNSTYGFNGTILVSAGTLQLNNSTSLPTTGVSFTVNAGTLNFNGVGLTAANLSGTGGTVALGGANLYVNAGNYAGAITGNGSVNLNSGLTLTLSGPSTYRGGTQITSGTLDLFGALGSGALNIAAAGTVEVESGGVLPASLTGNTNAGTIIDKGGSLGVDSLASTGNINFNNAAGNTVNCPITGTGTITQTAGTTTLNYPIAFSSATINGGELLDNNTTGLSISSLSGTGGEIALNGGALTIHNGTFPGQIGEAIDSGVSVHISGSVTLSGDNTYTGGTYLPTEGTGGLTVSTDNNLGDPAGAINFSGGNLQVANSFTTSRSVNIDLGGANISVPTGTATFNGTLSGAGSLTKSGSGDLVLTVPETYEDGTSVSQGTLEIDGPGSISQSLANLMVGTEAAQSASFELLATNGPATATVSNATIGNARSAGGYVEVDGTSNGSPSTLTVNQNLILGQTGGGTMSVSDGALVTIDGTVTIGSTGTGELSLATGGTFLTDGPISLASAANSYGTIYIGSTSTLSAPGILNAGIVTGGSGYADIIFDHTSNDYIFSTLIEGSTVVTVGDGTTVLTGKNTYTGGTEIYGGTLLVDNASGTGSGPVQVYGPGILGGDGSISGTATFGIGGTLAPGDPATLTFLSNLDLDVGAITFIQIAGPSDYDQIIVDGSAQLTGTLEFEFIDGFTPQPGEVFDIFQFLGGESGSFQSVDYPAAGDSGLFNPINGQFTFTSVPEPGILPALAIAGAYFSTRRRYAR